MNETRTILLVDDSADDLFLLRSAFKSAQLKNPVQEAHDGDEAVAYLEGAPPFDDRTRYPLPAVMLLDLNMPRRTGFQVLEWVRGQKGLKRLTVIVLTASLREEDLDRAFDLGASAFLVKPGSMEGLVAMSRALREWVGVLQLPNLVAV
jgi:CheY-like chemotaxis protein